MRGQTNVDIYFSHGQKERNVDNTSQYTHTHTKK